MVPHATREAHGANAREGGTNLQRTPAGARVHCSALQRAHAAAKHGRRSRPRRVPLRPLHESKQCRPHGRSQAQDRRASLGRIHGLHHNSQALQCILGGRRRVPAASCGAGRILSSAALCRRALLTGCPRRHSFRNHAVKRRVLVGVSSMLSLSHMDPRCLQCADVVERAIHEGEGVGEVLIRGPLTHGWQSTPKRRRLNERTGPGVRKANK
mmetsp:Transcript_20199/g.41875  ORF Transcript_20199/g.41875 Transcript_20199/m.41875 type:complete len:212 (+) Transcript_20199:746-1381(+)